MAEPQITRRQIVGFLVASAVGCSRLPEEVYEKPPQDPKVAKNDVAYLAPFNLTGNPDFDSLWVYRRWFAGWAATCGPGL